MNRTSHEAVVLEKFREIAKTNGMDSASSQESSNRIPIAGAVYYQFGDLRVELPDKIIIIEVESSGGVTNLAKYWECFDSGRLVKPLKLLHIYRQVSANDYRSHMIVWEFLCRKMQESMLDKFEGKLATYESGNLDSLKPAYEIFNGWLNEIAI